MAWIMPAETAPHERTWMAFPCEGQTLGSTDAERAEGYEAWSAVARAIAEYEAVTMVADPSEAARARNMLGRGIDVVEAPVDEFWMRDVGPTFVRDAEDPDRLGAVDWIFNGWGANDWADWDKSAKLGRLVAERSRSDRATEVISSVLVNEGGGIHTDGQGTVLATETVQLDPRRNPHADRERVEAEFARTLGSRKVIWLPRGLTRDYDEFGTNGHVDIVASFASPGTVLLHAQENPEHPDHAAMREIRAALEGQTDAEGRPLRILEVPAPELIRDAEGPVDFSYINHYVANGVVVACSFGEDRADGRAREILAEAYPGREVVSVEARPIFERGGGIHCITQQQPAVGDRA
ncbi:agmatine deiminase family protein [Curtobacterium sp. S6]|uniref:agmatine deiminase family protein n=1 Tax=Curtobacterium sp. S6 TaxID=1479623 RepID=UPI0004AB2B01|nr:agmatine deiminase family protein [Curtobacterium sp. S6]